VALLTLAAPAVGRAARFRRTVRPIPQARRFPPLALPAPLSLSLLSLHDTRASCSPSRTQRPFMPRLSVRSSPLLPGMRLSQYPPNAPSVYTVCLPLGFRIVWKRGGGSSRRFNSPAHASWRVGACLRAAAMTVRVEPGAPLKLPTEDMRDHRNRNCSGSVRDSGHSRCDQR
jgi:hypothetical protein